MAIVTLVICAILNTLVPCSAACRKQIRRLWPAECNAPFSPRISGHIHRETLRQPKIKVILSCPPILVYLYILAVQGIFHTLPYPGVSCVPAAAMNASAEKRLGATYW